MSNEELSAKLRLLREHGILRFKDADIEVELGYGIPLSGDKPKATLPIEPTEPEQPLNPADLILNPPDLELKVDPHDD